MTEGNPVLQLFGPLHALSARGLHVRASGGSWLLVVPMAPELLEPVRALCERVTLAQAASVLGLLERYLRADLARLSELRDRSGVVSCC